MCVVSAVGDYWRDRAPQQPWWPGVQPLIIPSLPQIAEVSRAEFDQLKRELEELKKLLAAAKEFDEKTGQPDCEMEEKVLLLRKLAKLVGVELPL